MKIKEIHIYGYGKLINVEIPRLSSLQVLYGENEAGKSTLMAFIHGILFGFPTKQQSVPRYEPKTHSKYGGILTMETDLYGDVIIERVKGKAVGDVTVKLADGEVGGEELLNKILRGIDKTMYQGIFSFNIHGLQGVNRLKGEDIGRYLFAAGTIGTDTIVKAEQQLQKEMDRLFKPNGRNPELNQILKTIRDEEKELKKSMQHNQNYDQLQQERFTLEQEINQLQGKITKGQKHLQKLEQFIHEWPLYLERKQILYRLNELGEINFPIDGLNRLEKLEEKLRVATSELNVLSERKKQLNEQLADSTPNPLFEKSNMQLQILLEKWPRVAQWQEEIIKLQAEFEKWNEQIENLQRQIHFNEEELRQFSNVDISIDMKDRLRSSMRDYYYLKSHETEVMKQEEKEKSKLLAIEKQCEKIESHLVSEEEFRSISVDQQIYYRLKQEQQQIQEQIKLNGNGTSKENNFQSLFLYALFIGFFLWSFVSKQTLIMIGSLLGVIVLSISFWLGKKKGKGAHSSGRAALEKRMKELVVELNKYPDMLSVYEEQQRLRQEWKEVVLHLEGQQIRYTETTNELTKWKLDWSKSQNQLSTLKQQLHLSESFSSEQLPDAYDILCELSRLLQSRENTMKQLNNLIQKQAGWHHKLDEQMNLLQLDGTPNEERIIRLKNELTIEEKKRRISSEIQTKLEKIRNEELKWQSEHSSLNNAMDNLLVEARVDKREEFRVKGKNHEEFSTLHAHLTIIEKKIDENDLRVIESIKSLKQLEYEQNMQSEKIQSDVALLDTFHKKLAQVNYEIGVLEEGGSFTQKLHEFYHLKSMFNAQARRWAKIALAKQILQRTMDRLKEERFPKVLNRAEDYLRILTNNEYIHLHFRDKGQFVVERKDRVVFEPEELSQATTEQVYVSLRLALVQVLKLDYPFPIIIDDGFVNFDENRTKNVIQLLIEISKTTQVIFFTCHQHLLDMFPRENIVNLMENEKYTLIN